MNRFVAEFRVIAAVAWNLVLTTSRVWLFLALFVAILFSLQWLFNIDQLIDIVLGDSGLGFVDRIDFLVDGFWNIFRFVGDIVPISMILIALVQALTITLLISFASRKGLRGKVGRSLGVSLVGVGCVACGGSILTPILSVLASNVSVAFAETVSNLLLIIALVLSYTAMSQVAHLVAQGVAKK